MRSAEADLQLEVSTKAGDRKDVETHAMHQVLARYTAQARELLFWVG
jgi:hypothetical protein